MNRETVFTFHISCFAPLGSAILAFGNIFQPDDVKRVDVHCVTSIIGNNHGSLRKEKEIEVRNRIRISARSHDRERPEVCGDAGPNMLNIHTEGSWRDLDETATPILAEFYFGFLAQRNFAGLERGLALTSSGAGRRTSSAIAE